MNTLTAEAVATTPADLFPETVTLLDGVDEVAYLTFSAASDLRAAISLAVARGYAIPAELHRALRYLSTAEITVPGVRSDDDGSHWTPEDADADASDRDED